MGFLISVDISGRYLLNQPIPSSVEINETIMVLAVFLGFVYTHAAGRNLRIDTFTRLLSPTLQSILEVFSSFAGLFLFALIVYKSWFIGWESWQSKEFLMGELKIPAYVSKLAVPIGGGLLCVEFIREIIYKLCKLLMRKL